MTKFTKFIKFVVEAAVVIARAIIIVVPAITALALFAYWYVSRRHGASAGIETARDEAVSGVVFVCVYAYLVVRRRRQMDAWDAENADN